MKCILHWYWDSGWVYKGFRYVLIYPFKITNDVAVIIFIEEIRVYIKYK